MLLTEMYHCARGGRLQSWLERVWCCDSFPKSVTNHTHFIHPLHPAACTPHLPHSASLLWLMEGGSSHYPTWFYFLASEGRKHSPSPANLLNTSLFPNLVYSIFFLNYFLNCSLLPATGKGKFSPEVWRGGVSFPLRLLRKLSLPLVAAWDCLLSSLPPVVSEQITKRRMFYSDNSANVEKNCW